MREKKSIENLFMEIMAVKFPKPGKKVDIHIQEA
jgi:hypothetical protein